MKNPNLGATIMDFMAILKCIEVYWSGHIEVYCTTVSKDFLMQVMKFLQNFSQVFLNVKCWL